MSKLPKDLFDNLFEVIFEARSNPIPVCVFHESFQEKKRLTNQSIIDLTEKFAANLMALHPTLKNKNILISLDNQWEFLISFFACIQTGNYPVPVSSKSLMAAADYQELVSNVFDSSDAALIISCANHQKYLPIELQTKHLSTENLSKVNPHHFKFRTDFKADDRLFIQYSSGSTRIPKGVVLTHGNLISNLEQIKLGLNLDPKVDSSLSWLPLHHDMGLIGMVFSAIYNVGTTHVISPIDFIKSPYEWLKLAGTLKVSIINSPNSGYHTCLNKISDEEVRTLDLSQIRVALSGAEPVNATVTRNFTKKFSACGLHENVFLPVYGLAEATLAVTFPPLGQPVKSLRLHFSRLIENKIVENNSTDGSDLVEIVSCGPALHLTQVKIMDDADKELNECEIGRIMIGGNAVASGYYVKGNSLSPIVDTNGWCDTGDLGFLKNKNLYITGRKKDLVIINGKNISPHDLELRISLLPTLKMGRIVIFSCVLPNEVKEKVFVIAETNLLPRSKRNKLKKQVLNILSQIVPLSLDQIYFIPPFHTKKTTSGKVRRFLMKELLLKGEIGKYEKHFLRYYLAAKLFVFKMIVQNLKN